MIHDMNFSFTVKNLKYFSVRASVLVFLIEHATLALSVLKCNMICLRLLPIVNLIY